MDRQFPPEIIQLIVKASLDPYDPFKWTISKPTLRYSILRTYSLLNSTWRDVSVPSLLKWVVLISKKDAELFLEAVEAGGGTLDRVKDLYIVSERRTSEHLSVLRAVPQVGNLFLRDCEVGVDDLAQLQQLGRLELFRVTVDRPPSSSTLSLPSARRLRLWESTVSTCASFFLTPPFLPRLRHLKLFVANVPAVMDSLIPQLEVISFSTAHDHSLSGAKALRLLRFPESHDDRLTVLSQLSTLPPFIAIDYQGRVRREDVAEQVVDALVQLLACQKEGLRVILLRVLRIGDAAEVVIKQLEGQAIRVVRQEEQLDMNRAISAMERILGEEKRAEEKDEKGRQ